MDANWQLIVGVFTVFFSFMGFVFYVLQIRLKPLENMVNQNKKDTEARISKEYEELEKKIDDFISSGQGFRQKVLDDLQDLKISKFKQDNENLEKYVSKEMFAIAIADFKDDRDREFTRMREEINSLKSNNSNS